MPSAGQPPLFNVKSAGESHKAAFGTLSFPNDLPGLSAMWTGKLMLRYLGHFPALRSATMAALTASTGPVIGGMCSTATNRLLVLPSIADDQA